VIVVEDCGPDPTLESFVKDEFGSRIAYIKNPRRRGLFGNWNACLERCQTEWITILHDDDLSGAGVYRGHDRVGKRIAGMRLVSWPNSHCERRWRTHAGTRLPDGVGALDETRFKGYSLFSVFFAGHLFRVSDARAVGGFREASFMCGDWEMWAKLMAFGGAAQSSRVVAFNRSHEGWDRGSHQAVPEREAPAHHVCIQHKRILALLGREQSTKIREDRHGSGGLPMSTRFLLQNSQTLSPRLLRYHVRLLLLSRPPHWRYALFQKMTRVGGVGFVKLASKMWRRMHSFAD
jgi:hypothetical protein